MRLLNYVSIAIIPAYILYSGVASLLGFEYFGIPEPGNAIYYIIVGVIFYIGIYIHMKMMGKMKHAK